MKKSTLLIVTLCFTVTLFSQWTPLNQPQSNALGLVVKKKILTGNSVDAMFIRSEKGEAEKTKLIKSSFNSNFGAGTFANHKYDSVVVKNVEVDYIDENQLNDNGAYKNTWFVYKGLRASEVTIYLTRDVEGEAKPKEILEAALKADILKYIPNRDSISFSYNSTKETAMTINNPKVYFEVQVKTKEGRNKGTTTFVCNGI